MTSESGAQPATRVLVAAGTALYDDPDQTNLNLVPQALSTVVQALVARGFVPTVSSPKSEVDQCAGALGVTVEVPEATGFLLNPEGDALQDALTEAAQSAQVIVFYYTGHGEKAEGGPYRLVLRQTDPRKPRTFMPATMLLEDLRPRTPDGVQLRTDQPYVLAIFDCCQAGEANAEALSAALASSHEPGAARIWVAATARSREAAIQGRFADALVEALAEADVGTVMPYIPMSELVRLIQRRMPTTGMFEQHLAVVPPNAALTGDVEPFFPNPAFNPQVAETIGTGLHHWLSRVRGLDDRADLGLYLTGGPGRVNAATDLSDWMSGQGGNGLAVVTGSPGSGKSTLLALPVLVAGTRETRDLVTSVSSPGQTLVRAVADRLPVDFSVAGIHAKGLTADRVAAHVSQQLGSPAQGARDLVTQVIDEGGDVVPTVLVVDAVDEAAQPADLVRSLLEPLSQHPDIKVVLGTRRNVLGAIHGEPLLIDLDSPEYQDPEALTDYIAQVLQARYEPEVATPYRGADDDDVRLVAQKLASRASSDLPAENRAESFLLGRLLATAVRSRPERVDVDESDWVHQLPANVGDAFDEDLRRRLGDEWLVGHALLTALAWARGVGLPREGIWTAVAQSISESTGTPITITESDVRRVLTRAGSYIVQGVGPGGRGVYRLFHELLSEHLRRQPDHERGQGDPALDQSQEQQHRQRVEAAITHALLEGGARTADGGTDWQLVHPYLRTHLAEHAHAAGQHVLHDVMGMPDFLAVADPSTLAPLLPLKADPDRDLTRIYRRARPTLGANAADNAAILQEAAVSLGLAESQATLFTGHIKPSYSAQWARIDTDSSVMTLIGHAGAINAVSFAEVDGMCMLASGGYDRVVRLWNADSGRPIGHPLAGHTGPLTSLAFGRIKGQTVLASSSWDGTVRLWNPVTGEPFGDPLQANAGRLFSVTMGDVAGKPVVACGDARKIRVWDPVLGKPLGPALVGHRDLVSSLALGRVKDRVLLASASDDATVRIWDPVSGTPIGKPLEGHQAPVWSVTFATIGGRSVLVSSGSDGTVRLWHPQEGQPIGQPLRGHVGRVSCVASGRIGPRTLLASVGDDLTVRLWDLDEGSAVTTLVGHTDRIQSVAFGSSQGREVVITAGSDETVRLWDPLDAEPVPSVVKGHRGPVRSVTFADLHGSAVLATAGDDQTVRVWEATTGEPVAPVLIEHVNRAPCLAITTLGDRCIAASGGWGELRLWDVDVGAQIGDPVTGHTDMVTSVAFSTVDNRKVLASAGSDGTVRLWDPDHGHLIGQLHASTSDSVDVIATCTMGTRSVLASGSGDGEVRLWDAANGHPLGPALLGHVGMVSALAFGTVAGRTILASGGHDATVRLWDPRTGEALGQPVDGHTDWIESLAFLPRNGHDLLLSGSADRTLRLWDPATRDPISVLRRRGRVRSLAVDESSRLVAVGEDTGVAVLRLGD